MDTLNTLPNFSTINIDQVIPQLKKLLQHNKDQLTALLTHPPKQWTWDTLMLPLDEWQNTLDKAWSPISHLQSVSNNPKLREIYQQGLDLLSDYHNAIAHNADLYEAIKTLSQEKNKLDTAQQTILQHSLRDFKLAGVSLEKSKQQRFKALDQKLTQLNNQFETQLLDATDAWDLHLPDTSRLTGLSHHALDLLATHAKEKNKPGFLVTLQFPSYYAIMTYADDRDLRETLYHAHSTRASDYGPKETDNTEVINEILATRHELAQLVGFNNYAEYSLATKMAEHPDKVLTFLEDLVTRSQPQARKEFEQLQQFAKTQGIDTLQPWDLSYFSEKFRQASFALNENTLRAYFPIKTVLQGLFTITEKLYGITITPHPEVDRWHEDVHCYALHDEKKQLRGYCYFDLFARSGKRGGAWMDEYCNFFLDSNKQLQRPIAYVNCNFSQGDSPLLTHEEVLTLFHEFGHALHHLLTKILYLEASGIKGVPWDAVEFPSQFFEHWCWHYEALICLTHHQQDKAPLPEALFEKMYSAKNFQSAMQLIRQLEFSLFDFNVHLNYQPDQKDYVQKTLDSVRSKISVTPMAPYNRFQHSFSHIFASGYAAGYYSYLWAEVLASDAFACFEQQGIFNETTGRHFLQCILEQGGSQDPALLFKQFTQHAPSIEALLKHRGINNAP